MYGVSLKAVTMGDSRNFRRAALTRTSGVWSGLPLAGWQQK
jgi:hypothetical protein